MLKKEDQSDFPTGGAGFRTPVGRELDHATAPLQAIRAFVNLCLSAPEQGATLAWLLHHLLSRSAEVAHEFREHFDRFIQQVEAGGASGCAEAVPPAPGALEGKRLYAAQELKLLGEEGARALARIQAAGHLDSAARESLLDSMFALQSDSDSFCPQLFFLLFLQSMALAGSIKTGPVPGCSSAPSGSAADA